MHEKASMEYQVRPYSVYKVVQLHYCATVPFWIGHIKDIQFHCSWLNRHSLVLPAGFYQFGILHI